ncbi:phage major capsid protein [Janibacter melonis]|uniref:phage major capsid protein n=1 Tax=Janibacter melonis TaxID=262209 RepID=UPI001919A07B|nr:phage major capsid protein [Janibacter melonis]
MTVKTSTAPELTAEQVAKILVQPLEERSQFLAAGPHIFDTAGPLRLPKAGGPIADPGWTGESEQIPERDADFDELHLLPSTMKSVKVITRYSNELARQSVVSLDAALKSRLVTDVAAKVDAQLFSATGDGVTTPKGMFAWAGTQEVVVGGALTLDHLLDAWGKALSANVNMSSLKWVMQPGDFVALRKIKDTSGHYLLTPDPTKDGVFRVWGSEVIITSRVPNTGGATPTGRAALVDFAEIAVARDLAPSVKILTERYADFDEQGIRVVTRYDAAPMNPAAVVKLTGIAR